MFKKSSATSDNYQSVVKSTIAQIESYLNEDNINVGEDEVTLKVVMDCYNRWLKEQDNIKKQYESIFCKGEYTNKHVEIYMRSNNVLGIYTTYDSESYHNNHNNYYVKILKNVNGEIDTMVTGSDDRTKHLIMTEPKLKEIFDFMKKYRRSVEKSWHVFSNEYFDVYLSSKSMNIKCNSSGIKVFSMSFDRYEKFNYETDSASVAMFLRDNESKILLGVVVKISDCPLCIQDELIKIRQNADQYEEQYQLIS